MSSKLTDLQYTQLGMLFLKAVILICSREATPAHGMMFGQIVYYAGKSRFGLSEALGELVFQSFDQKPLTGFFWGLFLRWFCCRTVTTAPFE